MRFPRWRCQRKGRNWFSRGETNSGHDRFHLFVCFDLVLAAKRIPEKDGFSNCCSSGHNIKGHNAGAKNLVMLVCVRGWYTINPEKGLFRCQAPAGSPLLWCIIYKLNPVSILGLQGHSRCSVSLLTMSLSTQRGDTLMITLTYILRLLMCGELPWDVHVVMNNPADSSGFSLQYIATR